MQTLQQWAVAMRLPLPLPLSANRRLVTLLAILFFCAVFYVQLSNASLLRKVSSEQDHGGSDQTLGSLKTTHSQKPIHSPKPWPQKIWQTGSKSMISKWKTQIQTWRNLNPEWQYKFLNDEDCDKYVDYRYHDQPVTQSFWHDLNSTIMRADLIRYMAMFKDGGVYSDVDTSCLRPIDEWIPAPYKWRDISVVAGIEYDDTTYPMFARPISLCQWTLMARPGHRIFKKAIARVIYHLEYVARVKHVGLGDLKLDKKEVLDATGPGAFTDSVMEVISDHEGRKVNWEELSQVKEPKRFGDVLILPINGFAGHQKHSHSGNPAYGPRLIQHHFGRSWYTQPEDAKKAKSNPASKAKDKAAA